MVILPQDLHKGKQGQRRKLMISAS